jgi:signal transduction histidine kinase
MHSKIKKLRLIFIIYWILLAYIIAALVWWFVALNRQNNVMADYKKAELNAHLPSYNISLEKIESAAARKKAQYVGEGIAFFLLIAAGAVFVFRSARRQLNFSLQQQNFMMALTHELKTPIAVTKLNLETLQKRKLDDQQRQRLIQTTLQEANRMNTLCNNMLLSSQIEVKGFRISEEEINLSELSSDCVQDFIIRYADKNITANIQENIFINGDRLLLQMVVNNLVDNAIKYSPKESPIVVVLSQKDHTITLQVKDNGKGIDAAEKVKVFKKFYRIGNTATKGAKGTGLGLYLTQKIVQEHNGNISVTDNTPSGCIFTITLQSSDQKN